MSAEQINLFTFHNVSINSFCLFCFRFINVHLHSTMSLLIRNLGRRKQKRRKQFTFHNVSINSQMRTQTHIRFIYLHSTMSLLILDTASTKNARKQFTFHNVSINSTNHRFIPGVNLSNLHSTMSLLIRI